MTLSTRFTMSRPALAAFLYAAVLPAVQARCFFRDDDDDDDDDDRYCGLSTGARVGIAVGVATFVFILIFLLIMNQRRRSSNSVPDAPPFIPNNNIPPPQLPPPTFYAAPPGPPVGSSLAPQLGFASQAPLDNGAQFAPPAGPPPSHLRNASGSEAPPAYIPPPPGSPMAQFADKGYAGAKAAEQV